ncbi:TPA: hypothetical protein N0F65_002795 [Lagenidium giganteum]|uniref:Uncharacterized protein n=1 Tax=Lagenidium giganteum TaxID=4803 RepID=A0AAV2YNL2_9STRA|nr:TPA: hypothetical protein N0F65_002795 [Lagenidium giganteum]
MLARVPALDLQRLEDFGSYDHRGLSGARSLPTRRDSEAPRPTSIEASTAKDYDAVQTTPLDNEQPTYRFQIQYKEEALRERVHANVRLLVQAAQNNSDDPSTTIQLAKKALRYRKLLDRLQCVNLSDPNVDVTQHLGVRWRKVA